MAHQLFYSLKKFSGSAHRTMRHLEADPDMPIDNPGGRQEALCVGE
jgi:hypothetical protein